MSFQSLECVIVTSLIKRANQILLNWGRFKGGHSHRLCTGASRVLAIFKLLSQSMHARNISCVSAVLAGSLKAIEMAF